MARSGPNTILETDLFDHPASQAWCELRSEHVVPLQIEILKGKRPNPTGTDRRIVCRLAGVGPNGADVIGKRSRHADAVVEHTIYESILPKLPIRSLHYYGMVEEADSIFCWLFLEDAGNEPYSMQLARHRGLIEDWLGRMHTSAINIVVPSGLPDRSPRHYLKRLQIARDAIVADLGQLALPPDDTAPVTSIITYYEMLESRWDRVEALCEGIPQTLVHGDFADKNIRIRNHQSRVILLPFDWGEAGWGVPATDIRDLNVSAYWSVVKGFWPWLNVYDIQRLANAGKIFRCLDAIYWELSRFDYEFLKHPQNSMSIYETWLSDAFRAAGLYN